MATVEKTIEDKVASLVTALGISSCQVISSWSRTAEDLSKAVIVTVRTSPRSYERHTTPTGTIQTTLTVSVRPECDADGAVMANAADKIFTLLQSYQDGIESVVNDFTLSGFTPHGFRLDGGSGPSLDVATGNNELSQSFTLQGVIS